MIDSTIQPLLELPEDRYSIRQQNGHWQIERTSPERHLAIISAWVSLLFLTMMIVASLMTGGWFVVLLLSIMLIMIFVYSNSVQAQKLHIQANKYKLRIVRSEIKREDEFILPWADRPSIERIGRTIGITSLTNQSPFSLKLDTVKEATQLHAALEALMTLYCPAEARESTQFDLLPIAGIVPGRSGRGDLLRLGRQANNRLNPDNGYADQYHIQLSDMSFWVMMTADQITKLQICMKIRSPLIGNSYVSPGHSPYMIGGKYANVTTFNFNHWRLLNLMGDCNTITLIQS